MDNKNWLTWDEKFWTLLLGVAEGVIVYEIIGLNGTCNLLNQSVMPCWKWGLIVWAISMLGTYYVLVKGSFWLFPKILKTVRLRYYQYKTGRDAKLITLSFRVENKYYISVHNEEFWFRANNVMVNSKFINLENVKINGSIKWDGNNPKTDTVSIKPKKYKTFHIATLSDDKLIIHFINGDEIFPFPNTIIPYYVIPLFMSGSISFLNYTIKRVRISVSESVYIYNDGKSELSWQKYITRDKPTT